MIAMTAMGFAVSPAQAELIKVHISINPSCRS
jgi:hypothetical protein